MAVQKLALSFALAWFLLAGLFLKGEATGTHCKRQQVRERKPTYETLHWQEACLPLAVIVGGCCGFVWWVLLVIYDLSQKGGQKGLPQISGEVELEEQKTTALDHKEEWTQAGTKLDDKEASKGDVAPRVEFGPYPPSQPKEQGHTTFWSFLEQELERILLAVRCHRTTGQNPMAEEKMSTPDVEKPNPLVGDWQSLLAYIKQYPLTAEGQSSPLPTDKQHPLPGEGPSSQGVDTQRPLFEEGQSSPAKDKQRPPSKERKRSPARETKKSPNRPRSRSKRKATTSPSSRRRGGSSGRRCPCSKRK